MYRYAIRRLLWFPPTLLLITLLVFVIVRLLPGDIVVLMLSEQGYASDRVKLEQMLGLDRPFSVQYLQYLGQIIRGNLGVSLWSGEPVLDEILRRLPVSLELAFLALLCGLLIGLPAGVLAAVRRESWVDYLCRTAAVGGLAVPSFWLATVIIVAASSAWKWVPPLRFTPLWEDPLANLAQFMPPALVLGLTLAAGIVRLTRSVVLEVLHEDYVRTARAKGLRESTVVVRHVLGNAMIPVVTMLGLHLSALIGGTVIMESVFVLPGLGRLLLEAILWRDYPVIQGINLVLASSVLALNLLTDLLYGRLDPRIRYD
jgi:peptide/nickel transport system permease protein